MDAATLCIRWNNAAVRDLCAVCGAECKPGMGLGLFTRDGGIVCDACGEIHAPALAAVVQCPEARDAAWAAQFNVRVSEPEEVGEGDDDDPFGDE